MQVVYRGYVASQSLQATHDDAVQTRTHLRLRTEAEEQEQKLQEFKLKREKERTKLSKLVVGLGSITLYIVINDVMGTLFKKIFSVVYYFFL